MLVQKPDAGDTETTTGLRLALRGSGVERARPLIRALTDASLGAIGRAIWHLRLAPLVWAIGDRNPKVVTYHACEPQEGDFVRGLDVNTPPDVFAAQIDFFAEFYRAVSVADLERGTVPRRSITITFDDGYTSVAEHAAPVLSRHGFPATVYLVTDVVGNDDIVWINELNWLLLQRPDTAPAIATEFLGIPTNTEPSDIVSSALNRGDPATVRALLDRLWADSPVSRKRLIENLDLYMPWDTIRQLKACGWSFGSHTATHCDLRSLDAEDLEAEIGRSIKVIEQELGECSSFAYPFSHATPESTAFARSLGLQSIMAGGGTNARLDPLRIARSPVTSACPAQIFAELEVVAPVKAFVRSTAQRLRRRVA